MNKLKWSEDQVDAGNRLRKAIRLKQLTEMDALCRKHPFVIRDTYPGFNDSAVESAVSTQDVRIVAKLLELGFSANPEIPEDETLPLEEAVTLTGADSLEIVKLLLERGADPNRGRPIVGAINVDEETVAIEYVKLLIDHGCDLNRIYELYGDSEEGFTALEWAAEKPKIAELIRSSGGLTKEDVLAGKAALIPRTKTKNSSGSARSSIDEVVAHFEATVGPASKKSLIQIVPTGMPIGIHVIPPKDSREHLTLFTNGLSSAPMNVPTGSEKYRFAELFMELPGDWKFKEVKDMKWAWPLIWLRKMARYPHNAGTWLGGPVTLIANSEPPQPLWPGSMFTALLLMAENSFKRSDREIVQLYRVIPLYTTEREYELKHGLKRFMQALDRDNVSFIVDVNRKPFV